MRFCEPNPKLVAASEGIWKDREPRIQAVSMIESDHWQELNVSKQRINQVTAKL